MNKKTVAVIGILQLVLGLVLSYQAGFASGGVFAPLPNATFSGPHSSVNFSPTSVTIMESQQQMFQVTSISVPVPNFLAYYKWVLDGSIISNDAVTTYKIFYGYDVGVGTHTVQCEVTIYLGNGVIDVVTCSGTLTVTAGSPATPVPTAMPTPTPSPTPYNPAPTPTPAPITGALVISIDNSQQSYPSGSSVSKTVFISGGGSPFAIHVFLNGGDTGAIVTSNSQVSASLPAYLNGQYVMYATVTDGHGRTSSSPTYQFLIGSQFIPVPSPSSQPGSFSVTVDTSKTAYLLLDSPISKMVYIQGGTAPYTVQVFLNLAQVGSVSAGNSQVSVNIPVTVAGQYSFYVRVTDSQGRTAESSDLKLTVSANALPSSSPSSTSYSSNPQNPNGNGNSQVNSMPFNLDPTTLAIFGVGVALMISGFLTSTYAFSMRKVK